MDEPLSWERRGQKYATIELTKCGESVTGFFVMSRVPRAQPHNADRRNMGSLNETLCRLL